MNTPSPDRQTLLDFLHGKLSDAESEQIAQLVESDPDVQSRLEELDRSGDTFIEMLRQYHEDTPTEGYSEYGDALDRAKNIFQNDLRQILGEYELLERIGQGGMGVVFKARHTKLGRTVAIKVIAENRAADTRAIARFEREIKAIGQLDHPSIVHAHDAREIDGRSILVMEYVDGMDLGRLIRRHGPISTADACELIRQAALGLQAAHELGLVHRDIKPSNLMLDRQGNLKILDLGLAREATDLKELQREVSMSFDLTQTGQAMGTADYMAPEQADHPGMVDIRADIYSLGCTLFKLLTGRAPYHEEMTFDKLSAHAETPLPATPDLPAPLRTILDRMTAKTPDDRFATPSEVADALAPFCTNHDLTALLEKAESQTAPAHTLPRPFSGGRFRKIITLFLLLAFSGGLGLFGGILLTINRNGKETQIEIPDGAQAKLFPNGNIAVDLHKAPPHQEPRPAVAENKLFGQQAGPWRDKSLSENEKERQRLVGAWQVTALRDSSSDKEHSTPTLIIGKETITALDRGQIHAAGPFELDIKTHEISFEGESISYAFDNDQLVFLDHVQSSQENYSTPKLPVAVLKKVELSNIKISPEAIQKTIDLFNNRRYGLITFQATNTSESASQIDRHAWNMLDQKPIINDYIQKLWITLDSDLNLDFLKKHFKVQGPTTIFLENGKEIFRYDGKFNYEAIKKKVQLLQPPISISPGKGSSWNGGGVVTIKPKLERLEECIGQRLKVTWPTGLEVKKLTTGYQHLKPQSVEWIIPEDAPRYSPLLFRVELFFPEAESIAATKHVDITACLLDAQNKEKPRTKTTTQITIEPRELQPPPMVAPLPEKEPSSKEPRPVPAGKNPLAQLTAPLLSKPPSENEKERQKFIGAWQLVAFTSEGKPLPVPDDTKSLKLELIIEEDYLKVIENGKEQNKSLFLIDATTTPKRIRWVDKKNYTYGIYKFEGNTLTICEDSIGGKGYPTSFDDTSTSTRYVWQRVIQAKARKVDPNSSESPLSENEKERQRLIGTWKVVSAKENGQTGLKDGDLIPMKLTITKDYIEWPTYPEDNIPVKTTAYPFIIDVTTTPKQISWPFGLKDMSIYKLEGDRLTICCSNPQQRGIPTDFVSEKDSTNNILIVFEREKPSTPAEKPPARPGFSTNRPASQKHAGTSPAANDSVQLPGVWKLVERPNRDGCLIFGGEKEKTPEVTVTFTDDKLYLRGNEIVSRQFSYEVSPDQKNINLLDGRNQVYRGVMSFEQDSKRLVLVSGEAIRPAGTWEFTGTNYEKLVLEKLETKPNLAINCPDKQLCKKWYSTFLKPYSTNYIEDSIQGRLFGCGNSPEEISKLDSVTFSGEGHITLAQSPHWSDDRDAWPKRWSYTTNPATTPKQIDIVTNKGTALKGIYKIEGDLLHIRFASKNHPRPNNFTSPLNKDLIELNFYQLPDPNPELAIVLKTHAGFVFNGRFIGSDSFNQYPIDPIVNITKKYPKTKVAIKAIRATASLIIYRRQLLNAGIKSVEIKLLDQHPSCWGYPTAVEYCPLKNLSKITDDPPEKLKTLSQELPTFFSRKSSGKNAGDGYLKIEKATLQPDNTIRVELSPQSIDLFKASEEMPSERIAVYLYDRIIIATPTLESLQKGSFDIDCKLSQGEREVLISLLESSNPTFGNMSSTGDEMH